MSMSQYNQFGGQGFNQGGFNPQAGFNPQGGFQGNQQGQQGGNTNSGAYDNLAEIEIIGNLSTIKDPTTGERVHAYSKPMNNGSKVANANVAVNIPGQDEAQFWKIEVWAQTPERASMHNFLMDHCQKGRKVLVKGTPLLNKDANGQIWPTIRVTRLIGFGGGSQENHGGNNQPSQNSGFQQQGNFQQQQNNGFQPQQGFNQGGFNPQSGFNAQSGFQGQPGFGAPQGQPQPVGAAAPGFGGPQGGFGAPQGGFGAPQR